MSACWSSYKSIARSIPCRQDPACMHAPDSWVIYNAYKYHDEIIFLTLMCTMHDILYIYSIRVIFSSIYTSSHVNIETIDQSIIHDSMWMYKSADGSWDSLWWLASYFALDTLLVLSLDSRRSISSDDSSKATRFGQDKMWWRQVSHACWINRRQTDVHYMVLDCVDSYQ